MERNGLFIGQLAQRTGIPIKTIRYYEEVGLLPKTQRTGSGYRVFGQEAAVWLEFVRKAQNLGLTLREIREILELSQRRTCPCGHVQQLLKQRLQELNKKMRDLQQLQGRILRALRHSSTPSAKRLSGIALCPRITGQPTMGKPAKSKGH